MLLVPNRNIMKMSIEANPVAFAGCILFFSLSSINHTLGQVGTCTSTAQVTTNINITAISWVSDGVNGLTAANCASIIAGTDQITPANFNVTVANGVVITVSISNTIFIHGNFDIPAGATGDNSTISINGGGAQTTLHVTGDLGDNTNNNIQYQVVAPTDHIIVDGTLYGKNNNQFIGTGTITGGSLNVKNGTTCGIPCPVSGGFTTCVAGDAFCTIYSILPILLSTFDATATDKAVNLKWSTASEINFDYFVLEKSNNGVEFTKLVQIKGSGTSNTRKEYSYTDHNPWIGSSYYRLTAIDFDGYTEVFNKNVVHVNVKAEKDFFITPNPLQGNTLKGEINFDTSRAQVVILDRVGEIVGKYSIGESAFELPLPSLPNGIYVAQFTSDEFTKSVRFAIH